MMEKILLGSSYLAQAIVMATIAFAVISTIYDIIKRLYVSQDGS